MTTARLVVAVELELEAGNDADAATLVKAVERAMVNQYVLTDGGRWIVTEAECESSAVSTRV